MHQKQTFVAMPSRPWRSDAIALMCSCESRLERKTMMRPSAPHASGAQQCLASTGWLVAGSSTTLWPITGVQQECKEGVGCGTGARPLQLADHTQHPAQQESVPSTMCHHGQIADRVLLVNIPHSNLPPSSPALLTSYNESRQKCKRVISVDKQCRMHAGLPRRHTCQIMHDQAAGITTSPRGATSQADHRSPHSGPLSHAAAAHASLSAVW